MKRPATLWLGLVVLLCGAADITMDDKSGAPESTAPLTDFYPAELSYQCSTGDNPRLEMMIKMQAGRNSDFVLELRNQSFNALANGARIKFDDDTPSRGVFALCLGDSTCLPVDAQLLVLDFQIPDLLKGGLTWYTDRRLPPVVSGFEAIRSDDSEIPTCKPPAEE